MKLNDINLNESYNRSPLPDWVAEEFELIGERQRGKPERFMVQLQQKMGGGVMSEAIEHCGDLIHRLTHMTTDDYYGYTELREKISKLQNLFHPRFEDEFYQNLKSNASFWGIEDVDSFIEQVEKGLEKYSMLHIMTYDTYNRIQGHCQSIPYQLGQLDIDSVKRNIKRLDEMTKTREILKENATEYNLSEHGNLLKVKY